MRAPLTPRLLAFAARMTALNGAAYMAREITAPRAGTTVWRMMLLASDMMDGLTQTKGKAKRLSPGQERSEESKAAKRKHGI